MIRGSQVLRDEGSCDPRSRGQKIFFLSNEQMHRRHWSVGFYQSLNSELFSLNMTNDDMTYVFMTQ